MKTLGASAAKLPFTVERLTKDDGRALYLFRLKNPGDDSPRRSRRGVPTSQNQPPKSRGTAIHGGVDTAAQVKPIAATQKGGQK